MGLRKLSFFSEIMYWLNTLVAFMLLASFLLPLLPPKSIPIIPLLSVIVGPLLLLNIGFAFFWLLQLKRKWMLSTLLVVIAYFYFTPFYEIYSTEDPVKSKNKLIVLSHNVRIFNAYEKVIDDVAISKIISDNNTEVTPDVICIQEYYRGTSHNFSEYPYRFIHFRHKKSNLGHAIFSKYPLINKEAFDFEGTQNNIIFSQVIKGNDTITVYNLHLNSLGVLASVSSLQEQDTSILKNRLMHAFRNQQDQVAAVLAHSKTLKHPFIMMGDFNNTPYSYIYDQLRESTKDAFDEKGSGFGTTFWFEWFPMRIDYILTSEEIEVQSFKTLKETFSDHYPVSASVSW
jgi:vancomycin resistance protein VanJ